MNTNSISKTNIQTNIFPDRMQEEKINIDREKFLKYINLVIHAMIEFGIKFYSKQTHITPDSFKFRNLNSNFSSIKISNLNTHGNILDQHLQALLTITIPSFSEKDLIAANYSYQISVIGRNNWNISREEEKDFIFRYPVIRHPPISSLLHYCADLMTALQDVVEFEQNSISYHIDSIGLEDDILTIPLTPPQQAFALGSRQSNVVALGDAQPLHSIAATEPAIICLASHWGLLSTILNIESNENHKINIDSFSLRHLGDWVMNSAKDPILVYEYLGRICNVACKFCYLFGNPDNIAIARGKKVVADSELETRLRYFDPIKGRALFQAQWEINEVLVDPKLKKTLRALRNISSQAFYFITNGNPLTKDIINFLAEVKPVHLVISTNTLDHVHREEIMQEKGSRTQISYSALSLLKEKEIPYGVSVVAFPAFPLEKLEETIYKLDEIKPAFVRINLHGFTRDHPYQDNKVDTHEFWSKVVQWVQALRKKVSIPLILIPSAYEQNFFYKDPNAARIIGTIPGSPAAIEGLWPDDVIKKVGIFAIKSRAELMSILMLQKNRIVMEVERDGKQRSVELLATTRSYYQYPGPLIAKYFFPFGLVIPPAISLRDIEFLRLKIQTRKAKQAWIITSNMMLPAVKPMIEAYAADVAPMLEFITVGNDFLGGNIQVLDMATIGDISKALDQALKTKKQPDVIFIPSTGFNQLGRDISGRHWKDLFYWYQIPIELFSVTTRFSY